MKNDKFELKAPDLYANRMGSKHRHATSASAESAPLDSFYNDDLLTLIYLCPSNLPDNFAPIQQALCVVANEKQESAARASAAITIGKFVRANRLTHKYLDGRSCPSSWFELARDFRSIVGAWEYANDLLASKDMRIKFDLDCDPIPKIVLGNGSIGSSVDLDVADAWFEGVRMIPWHAKEDFPEWEPRAYKCALACIVNYFTLLPSDRLNTLYGPSKAGLLGKRKNALKWVLPVWTQLIETMAVRKPLSDETRQALIEQKDIVCAYLDHLERATEWPNAQNPGEVDEKKESSRPNGTDKVVTEKNQLIVIRGEIPSTSDKDDRALLKQYDALKEPLTFKTLPTMEKLLNMRDQLHLEFPWAQEAIKTVMSELIARRRYGVTRLGMAPVLLTGPPGTGKTRFSQRLGDLLDTPNTVINLSGMGDNKMLKGVTRGWASHRPSRMIEFILQTKVPNPLFILDEIDKTEKGSNRAGSAQDALLDLLEKGNAKRYQDVFLMTECDLSHCLYIATCNSLKALSEPLKTRLQPVYFPAPGPEHSPVIIDGVIRDLENSWGLPNGVITLSNQQRNALRALSPREMKAAVLHMLGAGDDKKHCFH